MDVKKEVSTLPNWLFRNTLFVLEFAVFSEFLLFPRVLYWFCTRFVKAKLDAFELRPRMLDVKESTEFLAKGEVSFAGSSIIAEGCLRPSMLV